MDVDRIEIQDRFALKWDGKLEIRSQNGFRLTKKNCAGGQYGIWPMTGVE